MSASVCDLRVVRNWVRHHGVSLAEARTRGEQYVQHRIAVADKIRAGRLGGTASKGKPRKCALCREEGHHRGTCPDRDRYERERTITSAVDALRRVAGSLTVDARAEDLGRASNICSAWARHLGEMAIELQRLEAAAQTAVTT